MLSRKEKETMLLSMLNLKVGDEVRILNTNGTYRIEDVGAYYKLKNIIPNKLPYYVNVLVLNDYVKVGVIGDTLCGDYKMCKKCPLRAVSWNCGDNEKTTLFDNLKGLEKEDKDIFNFLIDRLNKEVNNG